VSCFCVGGPNCCAKVGYVADWTYRPTVIGPTLPSTTDANQVEFEPLSCSNGHDFVEVRSAEGILFCRRCAKRETVLI
jgi:hypothetical protein